MVAHMKLIECFLFEICLLSQLCTLIFIETKNTFFNRKNLNLHRIYKNTRATFIRCGTIKCATQI